MRRRRLRLERDRRSTKRLLAAETLDALQETVTEHFGGDWFHTMRTLASWSIDESKPQRDRIAALEAMQRCTILALSERERNEQLGHDCSADEFARKLAEIPSKEIRELLPQETIEELHVALTSALRD